MLCARNVTVVRTTSPQSPPWRKLPTKLRPPRDRGRTEHRHPELVREIERLGLFDRVKDVGLVGVDTPVPLLNGARVMVLPSLQEGFGIAVVEAFRCGTPVITVPTADRD